ncbi:MAK10-like protein [Tanacetum coccineum]
MHQAVSTTAQQVSFAGTGSHEPVRQKKYGYQGLKVKEKVERNLVLTHRRDENPIRTLGDYSKPIQEGYKNTIELPIGNNVVPRRSDTIRLAQNGCSFHGLRSEDPNQHLKDFLKLVDSLDLDGENKERTRLQIGRVADGKLRNKNTDESWEIIENLALYDHEGWDETKEFFKSVKDISTPQGISKTRNRRLLELEDQINFLLKGSRSTPTSRSAHTPQAYVNAVHPNSRLQNQNKPPILSTFAFRERTDPSPQPQALETTFEARVRDYMAAHTERIERFKNTIFKQRGEINGRMTEMFGLLKELTTSRTPEKVLIREEAKFPVTKNVNSISLTKGEEEKSNRTKVTPDNTEKLTETETEMPVVEVEKMNEVENGAKNKSIKTSENKEAMEAPGSQPITYYLKHKINEKLIKGLVNINRFNNSRSGTRVRKKKGRSINVGDLKHVKALVNQGSDVNIMPYSTYMRLTDKRPTKTDIRLSLAIHSYIYALGIAKDVLLERIEFLLSEWHICFPNNMAYSVNSIRRTDIKQTYTAYSNQLNMAYLSSGTCMTRSSTKELLSPFENPEQKFRSKRRLFDTPSLVESNSSEFDHNFDIEEQSKEEVRETMTETMEQYMSKTRENYRSGVTRPTINQDTPFELKGKFLKELSDNTFSGSEHEDANDQIEKVLEIVDLFHIPKVTQDQIMQEPVLYPSLELQGAIPSKIDADAKIVIQEMAEYSQKWHNGTSSRTRSTETSDGLAVIQAQLNNLEREIKKVNEKVYAAQVGCEICKGPHYKKDCPQKEEGKTLEESYYTWFGAPYQPGGHNRVAGPGFYQRNNGNSSYPDRRPSLKESLTKFMAESTKRHEENSNIIKEIRASTNAAIRNQGASIKTLEIQIRQMSNVLQERGFGSLPSSTETNPRDQVKSISTAKADFSRIRRIGCDPYAREAQDVKILDAYDHALPQKEKDSRRFTLPCFIHNICFDKALVDLGASVSIMSFSTYTNLGLGILSHTRLTVELSDRTIKQPRGIAENVQVRIGKFIFPTDFIILDIPEDDDIPLILGRPFLSTTHSKIDVFKRKITLRAGEEKLVFKSIKPATSIIKRISVIKSLDSKTELIGEGGEPFDPTYGNYIELNNLDTPLQPKTNQDVFEPTFAKTNSYKMKFSCVIGYKHVIADLLTSLPINLMSKSFYYSIIRDKDERESHAGTLIDIPIFVRSFSIISGFTIIDDDDMIKDIALGVRFCKKYASCQRIMKKFALRNNCEQIMEEE